MKKTFKKRAFISAIAMLVVSAIVLTSATYAWFSMAKRVEVSDMELNVTSPEGIQISANTSAFTTKLTVDNIKGTDDTAAGKRFNAYTGHINNVPETVRPSSSTLSVNNSLPRWFDGSINDAGSMDVYAVNNEVGSGFVAFDLFVKVKQATTIKFGKSTVTCEGNPELPTAMRIAVFNCGTVKENAEAATIQSTLALPTSELSRRVVYEVDALNHTTAAQAGGYSNGTYVATKGINTADTGIPCSGPSRNIINTRVLDISATVAKTAAEAKISVKEGITRLRVYMWMEGNDIDCANDIAGATLNFNLVLEID